MAWKPKQISLNHRPGAYSPESTEMAAVRQAAEDGVGPMHPLSQQHGFLQGTLLQSCDPYGEQCNVITAAQ